MLGSHSIVDLIDAHGLLGPDILISHATNLTQSDVEKMTKAGAFVSSTPDTELQMALGYPVCFREDMKDICSLGIDCHSNNSADIITQMRLGLQAERARRNEPLIEKDKAPRRLDLSVQDVFRLGTIQGARAINMQDQVGSLEEGKLADIVIFDALSPAMICAAEHDPVAAIVLHSSVRDIDTVIVDGRIRKRGGKLLPVNIDGSAAAADIGKNRVEWRDVAVQLLKSRERVEEATRRNQANDHVRLRETLAARVFHINPDNIV
ncbi:hypothetical protein VTN77DRAFT_8489 [Rasamsonia byssochlamydoides]|uniref:uncharacterized protein n=1 Tax=Rasamsonia byssochlamydoides TaxID=89139 RepID=UPI0037424CBE